jgi:hypothetical protein
VIISMRINDETVAGIDRLATAAGMSRSAWIARAISDSLVKRPEEVREVPAPSGARTSINVRLSAREIDAIDLVSARAGMTRMQWLKRTVRWRLWNRAGELRLAPVTARAITRLTFQVRALGRQLNQAVHALHAARQEMAASEVALAAEAVLAMDERLQPVIGGLADELQQLIAGEVSYWIDSHDVGAVAETVAA